MERKCELCPAQATLYCAADEAFVCWECDSHVHGANFLVARHCRSVLCRQCTAPTLWCATGACLRPTTSLCAVCTSDSLKSFDSREVSDKNQKANAVTTSQSVKIPDTGIHGTQSNMTIGSKASQAKETLWESPRSLQRNKRGGSSSDVTWSPDCRPGSPVSVIFSGRALGKKRRLVLEEDSVESSSESDVEDSDDRSVSQSNQVRRQISGSPFQWRNSFSFSTSVRGPSLVRTQNTTTEQSQGISNSNQLTFLELRRLGRGAEVRMERAIRDWYDHLNLRNPSIVALAMHILRRLLAVKISDMDALNARFVLAACLWIAIKLHHPRAARSRSRLYEQCTGVPFTVLLAAEAHIHRLLNRRVYPETLLGECESGR